MADIKLKLKDGTIVPGATTVVGLLDKSFLVKWANKLGLQGIEYQKYVDESARKGKLIHSILESHNAKHPVDLSEYTEDEINYLALVFRQHYLKWEQQHQLEPIFCEGSLVSEKYKFGGIIDMYCKLDGLYTVVDYKTSSSISKEHILQVSSYVELLKENNYPVDQLLILNIKKTMNDDLEVKYVNLEEASSYWEIFKHLLSIYWLKKDMKWDNKKKKEESKDGEQV